jgi:NADH dehydrogenase
MKYDVLLVGGSGFVGRVIGHQLQSKGYSVLLPFRRYSAIRDLRLLPNVTLMEADVNDRQTVQKLLAHLKPSATVINLVGILHDRNGVPYGPGFKKAHVDLPKLLIEEMKVAGIKRYIHMSALGADSKGPSMYQRSKGDAEHYVKASGLDWTIFRPSVIFGEQDKFINTFVSLAKVFPVIPLAYASALFQPVSVTDVASAFVIALKSPDTIHQSYDLVGPEVFSMKDLVRFATRKAGKSNMIIPIPNWMGYLQALAFEFGPGPTLMSRDNIASMSLPNTLPAGGRDALIDDFSMAKQRLESLLI